MLDRFRARCFTLAFTTLAAAMLAGCGGSTALTENGVVRGTIKNGVRTFSGVPYAGPPTGTNRFRPPRPAAPWYPATFDATKPGNICPQPGKSAANDQVSEDCLNLNVITPYPIGKKLPVLVWIHGGAFRSGAGRDYDATKLAKNGIVVVTLNYRLGLLGFLASSPLDDDDSAVHTGNYGIADQQFALAWIHRNILSFNGDPDQVTIAGQSAGAFSVCALMASPVSDLFARAIVQSGPCAYPYKSISEVEDYDKGIPAQLGCVTNVAVCLRLHTDVSTFYKVQQPPSPQAPLWVGPSVGGSELTKQPSTALGTKPLMLGGTKLENGFVLPISKAPTDEPTYEAAIGTLFGWKSHVLDNYPLVHFSGGFTALATVMTDNMVSNVLSPCYNVQSVRLQGATGSPAYAYEFSEVTAPPVVLLPELAGGALHASELQYLFPKASNAGWPLAEQQLADAMTTYWSNFVRTGDPNPSGPTSLPVWPKYSSSDMRTLQLGTPIKTIDLSADHQCSFWGLPD